MIVYIIDEIGSQPILVMGSKIVDEIMKTGECPVCRESFDFRCALESHAATALMVVERHIKSKSHKDRENIPKITDFLR